MKKPLKILHLVGDHEDAGGVLSVIRNLQKVTPASSMEHAVWVKEGYRESRKPPLQYRYSRYVVAESIHHWKLLAQAWPAFKELQSLLSNEPFHLLHAHSRGTLLVAILASKMLRRKVLFTNHNYAQRTGLYRWAARQPRI
ncbi:MAG: glycosyltransferase, partial [Limisphaerales bacterium]